MSETRNMYIKIIDDKKKKVFWISVQLYFCVLLHVLLFITYEISFAFYAYIFNFFQNGTMGGCSGDWLAFSGHLKASSGREYDKWIRTNMLNLVLKAVVHRKACHLMYWFLRLAATKSYFILREKNKKHQYQFFICFCFVLFV